MWKERGEDEERRRRRLEEVEERQQGEGESASETSESVGGLLLSPLHLDMKHHDEEGEESEEEDRGGAGEFAFTCRPEGQCKDRRSVTSCSSDGSSRRGEGPGSP